MPLAPPAVVVPLRSFAEPKTRLSTVLDADARRELTRELATRVVDAAREVGALLVVTDDDEVATWAGERAAIVVRQDAPGLNAAVTRGRDEARRRGLASVAVVPADLAQPAAIGPVITAAPVRGVTVVPDRHHDGTNLLVVPSDAAFRFAYGPASFSAHRAEADRLRIGCTVVLDDALGWDVDTPDDLARYRELVEQGQSN